MKTKKQLFLNSFLSSDSSDSLLECIRLTKTIDLAPADRLAVEKFSRWFSERKEWWVLVERRNCVGRRYFGRDFRFFRVYNRFDREYVRKTIRKFECVRLLSEDLSFVHFVLTVERHSSVCSSIKLLKENWNRLRALLKKKLGKNYPFIAVLEPHKDGYPHLHVLLFTNKYVFGHSELSAWCREHGLGYVVWLRRYWANGFRKKPILYLVKYLGKQFKREEWGVGDFLFYACLWYLKARSYTFGQFFGLSKRRRRRFELVRVGSRSEILGIVMRLVRCGFYVFDYPLDYFSWSLKDRLVWRKL